jgi:hypothetical protein
MMADVLFEHSLLTGKSTLVDGSLRNAAWHKQLFRRIRLEYPWYRIAIIHVTASREAIFARTAARALASGRVVPLALLESSMRHVPSSVKELSPDADLVAVVRNADGRPVILESLKVRGCPEEKCPSWAAFHAAWGQGCPSANPRPRLLGSRASSLAIRSGLKEKRATGQGVALGSHARTPNIHPSSVIEFLRAHRSKSIKSQGKRMLAAPLGPFAQTDAACEMLACLGLGKLLDEMRHRYWAPTVPTHLRSRPSHQTE